MTRFRFSCSTTQRPIVGFRTSKKECVRYVMLPVFAHPCHYPSHPVSLMVLFEITRTFLVARRGITNIYACELVGR